MVHYDRSLNKLYTNVYKDALNLYIFARSEAIFIFGF